MQLEQIISPDSKEKNAAARLKLNEIRERLKARSIFKVNTKKATENVLEVPFEEINSPIKSPGIKRDGEFAIHKKGFDDKY